MRVDLRLQRPDFQLALQILRIMEICQQVLNADSHGVEHPAQVADFIVGKMSNPGIEMAFFDRIDLPFHRLQRPV
ncbi:hypothetical protein D3C87_1663000 [compost metagenome]